MAVLALLPSAPATAAPGVPDTLVTGHVAGAQAGHHVGVTASGIACRVVAGGITDAAGAYQVVVSGCRPGTATVTVDGRATATTFSIRPGVPINADSQNPAKTPAPPRTTATPTQRPRQSPPTPITKPSTTPSPGKPTVLPRTAAPTSGGMQVPDGLVTGTIAGARQGQVVSVALGGKTCASKAGGRTNSSGAFALVVGNCGPGPASILLDSAQTGITFMAHPGVPIAVSGKVATP